MKRFAFVVLMAAWWLEQRLVSGRLRTWLAVTMRRAYWSSRLASLGSDTRIGAYVVMHQPQNVRIGKNCSIAEFVHIWGGGGVTIGDSVLVASHVAITSMTHDTCADVFAETLIKRPVTIADNVWIGAGAKILPGVNLGTGSIVAAGAVVTKDVAPCTIVAGVPAKVLRLTIKTEAE